jgi:CheY-like chemotaxis protein
VAAVLEMLIEHPQVLQHKDGTRVALYREFSTFFNAHARNHLLEQSETNPTEELLLQIPSVAREAFLLVALEGFSEADAASVLRVEIEELRSLVEDAGRELSKEIATDVLIIENEAIIAMDLEGLVQALGHRVLGVARTHSEAIALAKVSPPGLILADIQLADGSSGIEAVNEILKDHSIPTIFITAYPERFLSGPRPEPAFLIAKPFQVATVSAVITQALFFGRNARPGP